MQLHQQEELDYLGCHKFCLWDLEKVGENEEFFDFAFLSKEGFHNKGILNRHNFNYCSGLK